MAILPNPAFFSIDKGDPDDYRPHSRFALLADPARNDDGAYVENLAVILERIAPGDRIPLHRHPIDEAIVVESGEVEVRLGGESVVVTGRSVVFVPAGTEHGARNIGADDAVYTAFFPSPRIEIEYLERNPAPGTEGDDPQPPVLYDARS